MTRPQIQRRSDMHTGYRLRNVSGTVVVDPVDNPYIIATITGVTTFKPAPKPKSGYDDGATFKLYVYGITTTNTATFQTANDSVTIPSGSNYVTGLYNKADNSWTITTGVASPLQA